MRVQSAVLLAGGLLLASAGTRFPEAEGEVAVAHDPGLRQTTYTIASGACRISWTVFSTDLNRGVILQHAACALPLAEQVPLISKLLRKVIESDAEPARFRTLSWGRLYPDGPKDLTLATRLALAAKRSPQWDAARGVARTGDVNGFVRKLANDASIYEELRPMFRQAGLEIGLSSVEKVLVLPARRLEFFERLRSAGVQAQDKLPFDCMVWFQMR
jgi:hypothetical protein